MRQLTGTWKCTAVVDRITGQQCGHTEKQPAKTLAVYHECHPSKGGVRKLTELKRVR